MAIKENVTYSSISMAWIKFLLCVANFIFLLAGVNIIFKGGLIFDLYENFFYFFNSRYVSPAALLFIAGVLVLIISIFSCYGAIKESTCMVLTSAFLLSTVLILEFATSITAYVYKDDIVNIMKIKLNNTMYQYHSDNKAKNAMDFLQDQFGCCGNNGPEDWEYVAERQSIRNSLPSCFWWSLTESREPGCFKLLADLIGDSADYLITAAIMIALVQITGIILTCMLGRMIRKQKTLREMRKWQMQMSLPNLDEPLEKAASLSCSPTVIT
ncbi:leukocyte surface antigen CD53 [Copidosoma floridanum]|uniref:leukocyte surface antigen CD53 n=1 Tax=Copidosoma floridanum TaxID=29053 RepID=UPI0006C94EBE|nr:leukocyte surface antigen CD53 [Copidosoma floridanum]